MRVTWIALEWPRQGVHSGGVGRYVQRLAADLSAMVELSVVVRSNAVPTAGVSFFEVAESGSRFGRFYVEPLRVARILKRTAPDIVHSHGDDWALRGQVPRVRTFHGTAWGEAKSSTGLRALNHRLLAGMELLAAARSDLRLAVAPESARMFRAHYVMPPVLQRREVALVPKTREPSVLFVGSYGGRKRGWLAQDVMNEVRSTGLGSGATLRVVGPESDRDLWDPWVLFRSGLDDAQVDAMVAESWLLLAPSQYEGFGIPSFEALSNCVPIVVTENPGSSFIVGDALPEGAAYLCGTKADLVHAVLEAIGRGPNMDLAAAQATSERVEELLRLGSARRLVQLYEEVLRARPPRRVR